MAGELTHEVVDPVAFDGVVIQLLLGGTRFLPTQTFRRSMIFALTSEIHMERMTSGCLKI